MKRADKVIISCAITGSIHTPSMSQYLPVTPQQIAESAIGAAKAGAAILHLHARDPETGRPTQSPDVYKQFLPAIKAGCDGIVNITTGGGLGMTMDERLAAAKWAEPEIASMNMGSLNFNISAAGGRITEFKNDWEKPYLEMTRDFILSNTFTQIERGMTELTALGTRFEFECYDVGHLYNLAHFADRGIIKPPFFVQSIFGILGGIGAEPENLMHMKATADRLFGNDYYLSILAAAPERYERYIVQVRQEYACFDDEQFRAGRSKFLQSLATKTLFKTDRFKSAEAAAKSNVEKELQLLMSGK